MRQMSELLPIFAAAKVVPVVALEDADAAPFLAEALIKGGINVIEIVLRTEQAFKAAENIRKAHPDMCLGIGTLINPDQIQAAADIGADFLVTPGTTPLLAQTCLESKIPTFPGCSTTSEAVQLLEYGFDILKFFPAEASGGVATIKAIGGPLPQLRFMPTGGISKDKVASYLALPSIIACGGSWVADKASLKAKDWARITNQAQQACSITP